MKTISKALDTAVYAENLEDIIFEGRNHSYGAYYLRKHYNNHLLVSLLVVVIFATVLAGIPHLRAMFFSKVVTVPEYVAPRGPVTISTVDIIQPYTPPREPDVFKQIVNRRSILPPVVVDGVVDNTNKGLEVVDFGDEEPNDNFLGNIPFFPTGGGAGEEIDTEKKKTFNSYEVDEPAVFKYGSFSEWLGNNIVYDQDAIDAHIAGKICIRFSIDEEGKISNIIVERSLHPLLDKAVVEAIKKSPKWKPAKHNGYKVKVFYRVPLKFEVDK